MNQKDLSVYKKLDILDGIEILYAYGHTVNFPKHTHPTFNIALVINQPFYSELDSKFVRAPIGSLCITNPEEIHATPCDNKMGNTFTTFYISPELLKQINKGQEVFFKDKVIYAPQLFSNLLYLSKNLDNPYLDIEKEIVKNLKILVKNNTEPHSFISQEKRLLSRFIEESFTNFSLDKTAQSFGMNKYKFLRLFKQETGLTPKNFAAIKRIEKAKELISKNNDLMSVALDSGFYDQAHMTKEFKRYTGVTPNTYQKA